jgi:hypothetical protein
MAMSKPKQVALSFSLSALQNATQSPFYTLASSYHHCPFEFALPQAKSFVDS